MAYGYWQKGMVKPTRKTAPDRLKGRARSRTGTMEHDWGCHTVYDSGEERCGVHKNKRGNIRTKVVLATANSCSAEERQRQRENIRREDQTDQTGSANILQVNKEPFDRTDYRESLSIMKKKKGQRRKELWQFFFFNKHHFKYVELLLKARFCLLNINNNSPEETWTNNTFASASELNTESFKKRFLLHILLQQYT